MNIDRSMLRTNPALRVDYALAFWSLIASRKTLELGHFHAHPVHRSIKRMCYHLEGDFFFGKSKKTRGQFFFSEPKIFILARDAQSSCISAKKTRKERNGALVELFQC